MSFQKYSAIVFDLGNVLINFDYKIAVEKFNSIEPDLGNKFFEYHRNNYQIHRNFEKGIINQDEFVKIALKGIGHRINYETFSEIYSDIFTSNDEVISLLPILKRKYKLILLSNTDPLHKKFGWDKYTFLDQFDHKVLSFEVGSVKPEEKIYSAVEEYSKSAPQEHLYIDDISEYTETARKRGWDAIQFINYAKLKEELKARDVLRDVQL